MPLLYNVNLFRAAGLAPPSGSMSFLEFENLAKALTSPDGSRRALVVPLDSWVTYGWIRANGGDLLKVDASGRPQFSFNSPPVVDTLTYLTRLIDSGVAFG